MGHPPGINFPSPSLHSPDVVPFVCIIKFFPMETQGTFNIEDPASRLLMTLENADEILLLASELEAEAIVITISQTF